MPANYSTNIVYLSKAQYQELLTNQTITANGTTVTYNENDIYVTPQAEPITDVKLAGTSIGSNGVANIPLASLNSPGLIKGGINDAIVAYNGILIFNYATNAINKAGTSNTNPVVPMTAHSAAFYGLSKVAGVDLANETVTLGIYPDTSKAAIQNMLGITDLLSTEESSTATTAHAINNTFMMNGKLHRATVAIAIGDAVEVGTNCEVVKADQMFVKNTDIARGVPGIVTVETGTGSYGVSFYSSNSSVLTTVAATSNNLKAGTNAYKPVVPSNLSDATYYGLSKLAGVDLANETVTVGTYPETSKTAIRSLIGAAAASSAVTDVQVNGSSVVSNNVANIPIATTNDYGVVKVQPLNGIGLSNTNKLLIITATDEEIKIATNAYAPITPANQHNSVFYGLAKAAGDETQSISTNAVGTYTSDASAAIRSMLGAVGDVQVNGMSIVNNGIANIPYASNTTAGVVKILNSYGIKINSTTGYIGIVAADDNDIHNGSSEFKVITPRYQHTSVFYGLAKAAGDTTQSASSNAVGTYTADAKAAIHTMLGIDPASIAAQVDIPLVETVTGTTPSITGQPNVRYVCSEVSTLSLTPPASGSMDVIFESGSTATVLTVPNTVKWPAWFDATSLETDTTYEILITDATYGSVMTWET